MPTEWMPRVKGIEEQIKAERLKLWLRRQPSVVESAPPEVLAASTPLPTTTREPTEWSPRMIAAPEEPESFALPQRTQPRARVAPTTSRVTPPTISREPVAPMQRDPEDVSTTAQPKKEYAWWEEPAKVTDVVMEGVGKALSKVPVLPDILEFAAPLFEWLHEKVEVPVATLLTSPFSAFMPIVPWKKGENWFDHQRRVYEAWEAPTYVKGAAEQVLWWIPWLGWTIKGARALGAGHQIAASAAKIAKQTGRLGKIILPTDKVLVNSLFKPSILKTASMWMENKPILARVAKAIGGPGVFLSGDPTDPVGMISRAVLKKVVLGDMRHGAAAIWMNKLQKFGDPVKLLQIADDGLMGVAKSATKGASLYVDDVLENIIEGGTKYTIEGVRANQYVKAFKSVADDIFELAAQNRVTVPKSGKLHRLVLGKYTETIGGGTKPGFEPSKTGSYFGKARLYNTMEEGVKAAEPIKYVINPNENIKSMANHYILKIADKRFTDEVGKYGKTALTMWADANPQAAHNIVNLRLQINAGKHAAKALKRINSYAGTSIPSSTLTKINSVLPDVAASIDQALSLGPRKTLKVIEAISDDALKALNLSRADFKVQLYQKIKKPGKKILLRDIDAVVNTFFKDTKRATKLIEQIHLQAYTLNKEAFQGAFKTIQRKVEKIIKSRTAELSPLMAERKLAVKHLSGTRQILGKGAKFTKHPVFRNKIFNAEVVRIAEAALGDKGNKWLAGMEKVSATSRMMVATADFSAPFIQGLPTLALNPAAWTKATLKMYQYFLSPKKLYQFLDDPVQKLVRAERVAAGGAAGSFEFFEALAPVQKLVGGTPVVGKGLKKAVQQTLGRAEAAFSGFGETARNYLWMALKKPGMDDDALRGLARSIDRMTGVMSTEALGIGLTQRQFEGAWMFFSPRYTRAGLALVGDTLRGGATGKTAWKSLGLMMGGGLSMYYGICSVLGQQPHLDPKSARFMTIKVGDSYVGLGGIYYALMRLGADIGTTAFDEPLDFVRLNRFDNPFLKFMYNRSAPLTGLATGLAIEQKNYLGEPFESPADWGKFLAEKVTPIAAQTIMPWGDEGASPAVFAAEVLGARTFPKNAWELRNETREKYAQQIHSSSYESLTELEQHKIDRMPDIKVLDEEADVRSEQRGGLNAAFVRRKRARDEAHLQYIEALEQSQGAVDAGLLDGFEYRELLEKAKSGLHTTYDFIDRQPEYEEVLTKLQEPKDTKPTHAGDIAYDELMTASYTGEFEDEYGIFKFDKYNEFLDIFREKHGEDIYQYVLDRKDQNREDEPPMAQEYYKASRVLEPYWGVYDWAVKTFGKAWADSPSGSAFITRTKKYMRLNNPEIAKYYDMFYKRG